MVISLMAYDNRHGVWLQTTCFSKALYNVFPRRKYGSTSKEGYFASLLIQIYLIFLTKQVHFVLRIGISDKICLAC